MARESLFLLYRPRVWTFASWIRSWFFFWATLGKLLTLGSRYQEEGTGLCVFGCVLFVVPTGKGDFWILVFGIVSAHVTSGLFVSSKYWSVLRGGWLRLGIVLSAGSWSVDIKDRKPGMSLLLNLGGLGPGKNLWDCGRIIGVVFIHIGLYVYGGLCIERFGIVLPKLLSMRDLETPCWLKGYRPCS